jgi:hypothetical protein
MGRASRAPSVTVPDNVVPSSFRSTVIGWAMPWPSAADSSPIHFPATPVCANAGTDANARTKSIVESFSFICFSLTYLRAGYYLIRKSCVNVLMSDFDVGEFTTDG